MIHFEHDRWTRLVHINQHIFLLFLFMTPCLARGQTHLRPRSMDEAPVHAEIILAGPGDQLYSLFGHVAVYVNDRGNETVYDLGATRDLGGGGLINQLLGRADFLGEMKNFNRLVSHWKQQDRDVFRYPLRLSQGQLEAFIRELKSRTNAQGGSYIYDPMRENCAIQVRRSLDIALDGALSRTSSLQAPSGERFRDFVRIGYAQQTLISLGIELFVGVTLDVPRSRWELGYRPAEMVDQLKQVKIQGHSIIGEQQVIHRRFAPPPIGGWRSLLPPILTSIIALFLVGLSLPKQKNTQRQWMVWTSLRLSSALMAFLGMFALFFALKSAWPELRSSWMLLLVSPLDGMLLSLNRRSSFNTLRLMRLYLVLRGGMSVGLVVFIGFILGGWPPVSALILSMGAWWACFLSISVIESKLIQTHQDQLVSPVKMEEDELSWAELL